MTDTAQPQRTAWPRLYGTSARIGMIVPPSNTTNESETAAFAPPGVTVHTTRMRLHLDAGKPGFEEEVYADLDAAVDLLAPLEPTVVVYACTAGSMLLPRADVIARMERRAGCPAITTSGAIQDALSALGVTRVAVATPYEEPLNAHERHWFEDQGIGVTAIGGLDICVTTRDVRNLCRVPEDVLENLAADVLARGGAPEALQLSCTDLPTFHLIERFENRFGLPVVSSNQATFWAALRASGVDDPVTGLGRLLTL